MFSYQSNSAHNVADSTTEVNTMPKLKDRIAFRAVREALELMRSAHVLDGKVKATVETLLQLALQRLRGYDSQHTALPTGVNNESEL